MNIKRNLSAFQFGEFVLQDEGIRLKREYEEKKQLFYSSVLLIALKPSYLPMYAFVFIVKFEIRTALGSARYERSQFILVEVLCAEISVILLIVVIVYTVLAVCDRFAVYHTYHPLSV